MNISGAAAAASAGDDGSICKSDADLLNIYGRLGGWGGGRCSTSALKLRKSSQVPKLSAGPEQPGRLHAAPCCSSARSRNPVADGNRGALNVTMAFMSPVHGCRGRGGGDVLPRPGWSLSNTVNNHLPPDDGRKRPLLPQFPSVVGSSSAGSTLAV